jgi:hypothetical protein
MFESLTQLNMENVHVCLLLRSWEFPRAHCARYLRRRLKIIGHHLKCQSSQKTPSNSCLFRNQCGNRTFSLLSWCSMPASIFPLIPVIYRPVELVHSLLSYSIRASSYHCISRHFFLHISIVLIHPHCHSSHKQALEAKKSVKLNFLSPL